MLTRLPDWRERLDAFINEVRRTPFEWATFDCGPPFTGRAVEAVTGTNPFAAYAGKYSTPEGALRVVLGAGFRNLADMVASILPEIPPSRATVGDLAAVYHPGELGWSLGVVNGERIFMLHETGLVTVDLLGAKRAFKVG